MENARERQREGLASGGTSGQLTLLCKANMGSAEVRQHCPPHHAAKNLCSHLAIRSAKPPASRFAGLRTAMTHLAMSARAFRRILKLTRTIADLEGSAEVKTHHLAEAIQYKPPRQI